MFFVSRQLLLSVGSTFGRGKGGGWCGDRDGVGGGGILQQLPPMCVASDHSLSPLAGPRTNIEAKKEKKIDPPRFHLLGQSTKSRQPANTLFKESKGVVIIEQKYLFLNCHEFNNLIFCWLL
jgi:hypothetical protein